MIDWENRANWPWMTPGEAQGQIVTVSYCWRDGFLHRRTVDGSDGSTSYAWTEHGPEDYDPWDPHHPSVDEEDWQCAE